MAVRETRIDDLDGSTDNVRTVSFALDGATYEIDLSAENRSVLLDAVRPFIGAGRMIASPTKKPRRAPKKSGSAVRQWARDNGIPVPDRGRIPKHINDAYSAQHPG